MRRGCSALEADRGSLKLVFRHPSLRRPPMKVFSLQAPIYRGAWLSSRLTAQTSQLAAVRRDALERWRRARSRGLSAEEAARAVGASRASLYRWEKRLEPRSRRPHRQRQPTWTSALMRKIERLRADHPMWGKRKLAVLLRREGIDVSVSMVGRILTKLMARGVVTPVPMLRRKPGLGVALAHDAQARRQPGAAIDWRLKAKNLHRGSPETGVSKHQLQRSPIRFKGRADPSHIYLNSDRIRSSKRAHREEAQVQLGIFALVP